MFHETIIPTLITIFADIRTVVSVIAVGISIGTFWITYHKGKKSEQAKIAMDISDRLDEAENRIFSLHEDLKKGQNLDLRYDVLSISENIKDAEVLHMNHWEFYSLLVNTGQIDNKKIKKHFEQSFIDDTDDFFSDYPEYIKKEEKFSEIKELRKKMKKELKSPTG